MFKWQISNIYTSQYVDCMDGLDLVAFIEITHENHIRYVYNFRNHTHLLRYDGSDDYVHS